MGLTAAEHVARAVRVIAARLAPLQLHDNARRTNAQARAALHGLEIGLGLLVAVEIVLGPWALIRWLARLLRRRRAVEAWRLLEAH